MLLTNIGGSSRAAAKPGMPVSEPPPTLSSLPRRKDAAMTEYKYVNYETFDDGTIARIMLNRPETRNAQNRGLLVELDEAFLRGRGRRHGPGRHPRRRRPDVLRPATTWARGSRIEERQPGPNQHPTVADQRRHPAGRRAADAAGVALLLREHAALAQPAQDHHRPGARHGVRGRADADVGLRPDRGRRGRPVRRRRRHPARDVRRRVLRPPVGVRARARPRS